jgi:dihydroorotate dehydrogenase electron transfer subunit
LLNDKESFIEINLSRFYGRKTTIKMNNMFQKEATVVKKEQLGPQIHRLTFSAYEIARRAKPGQFVMLRAAQGLDPLLRRPFSIHQVTENGTLQILFKIVGRGTQYLASLSVGDIIDIVGPLGNSFTTGASGGHCLIGGGMGVAPMLFLAKEMIQSNRPIELKVLLGAQTKDEIVSLLLNFSELGVEVLHATDDGSSGHHGFVTELMEPALLKSTEKVWNIHCCGPQPMLKQVAAICEKKRWNCWVSMETMMACGIGACLGCTIRGADASLMPSSTNYLHVCKDGPVFSAVDIQW